MVVLELEYKLNKLRKIANYFKCCLHYMQFCLKTIYYVLVYKLNKTLQFFNYEKYIQCKIINFTCRQQYILKYLNKIIVY